MKNTKQLILDLLALFPIEICYEERLRFVAIDLNTTVEDILKILNS